MKIYPQNTTDVNQLFTAIGSEQKGKVRCKSAGSQVNAAESQA
ncbi:hypothetical protein Z945_835 [Sulfitobacter noctilucae]|nr:hypothetical protein Z945_835 [Sulfitobacter noctilucae]